MSLYWLFTSFKSKQPFIEDPRVDEYVLQREKCPRTGNLHWQGYIAFDTPVTRHEVMKCLRRHPCYCEPTRWEGAKAYCAKTITQHSPTIVFSRK